MVRSLCLAAAVSLLQLSVAAAAPSDGVMSGPGAFAVKMVCAVNRPNGSAAHQVAILLSDDAGATCPNVVYDGQKNALRDGNTLMFTLQKEPQLGPGAFTTRNVALLGSALEARSRQELPKMPDLPSDRPPTEAELKKFMAAAEAMQKSAHEREAGVKADATAAGGLVTGSALISVGKNARPRRDFQDVVVTLTAYSPQRVAGTFVITLQPVGRSTVKEELKGSFSAPLTVDPRGD